MRRYVYVDFSNLWWEGQHLAAVENGKTPNLFRALKHNVTSAWHCDFPALHAYLGGEKLDRALLVTSDPFTAQKHARSAGFEVHTFPRSRHGREKRVDTYLVAQAIADGLQCATPETHEIHLVTGDLDQEPAVTLLRNQGYTVVVHFWDHAARGLKSACTSFASLNPQWATLTHA